MIQTERKYAQIDKEMLAIVCGSENYDPFIYGHRIVIETDHKPYITQIGTQYSKVSTKNATSNVKV